MSVKSNTGIMRAAPSEHSEMIFEVVEKKQVSIVYQPIVDVHRRKIFAYEALARSQSDFFAGPLPLFDAAVKHGCVGELGRLLRRLAVNGCPHAPLFINMHPTELNAEYIIRPDDAIFQHYEDVFLEVTESVPLSHFALCKTMLAEVRGRGVHLVVDDLGAGYSNLKYIADLHPRVVKLDRELIMGLTIESRLFKLVTAIVRLCSDLGAMVVCEGIETKTELQAVMATGARFAQGYLLARPGNPLPDARWPADDQEPDEWLSPPQRKHATLRMRRPTGV